MSVPIRKKSNNVPQQYKIPIHTNIRGMFKHPNASAAPSARLNSKGVAMETIRNQLINENNNDQ